MGEGPVRRHGSTIEFEILATRGTRRSLTGCAVVYGFDSGRGVGNNELPADIGPTNRLAREDGNGLRSESEHVVINHAHEHLNRWGGCLHVGHARNMTCRDGRA